MDVRQLARHPDGDAHSVFNSREETGTKEAEDKLGAFLPGYCQYVP
jgi:hypothetical protein